jgi:hypothetical protein
MISSVDGGDDEQNSEYDGDYLDDDLEGDYLEDLSD